MNDEVVAGNPISPETFAGRLIEARAATPCKRLEILIRLRDDLNLELARAAMDVENHDG